MGKDSFCSFYTMAQALKVEDFPNTGLLKTNVLETHGRNKLHNSLQFFTKFLNVIFVIVSQKGTSFLCIK